MEYLKILVLILKMLLLLPLRVLRATLTALWEVARSSGYLKYYAMGYLKILVLLPPRVLRGTLRALWKVARKG